MMRFKQHDSVTWTSQAGGYSSVKTGVVAEVVPAGAQPTRDRFPTLYTGSGIGSPRKSESYVVLVGSKPYWPREGLLRPAGDPLNVAMCPGCGSRIPTENTGCPECGYEDPNCGRILTIAEIIRQPSYPEIGHAVYQDVSPAFIAAVVAAARARNTK